MNTEMKNEVTESHTPEAQAKVQGMIEPKSHARRWITYGVVAALVMTLGAVMILKVVSRFGAGHTVGADYYRSEISINGEKYAVEIDEEDRGVGVRRIVHLNIDGVTFHGITGHDYDGDGRWDRVFYCGAHPMLSSSDSSLGCNSVVRTDGGWGRREWEFEPCSSDEGKIAAFSPLAIAFAISQLDLAMDEVRQEKYLTERWRWDEKKRSVVLVFPPTSNT